MFFGSKYIVKPLEKNISLYNLLRGSIKPVQSGFSNPHCNSNRCHVIVNFYVQIYPQIPDPYIYTYINIYVLLDKLYCTIRCVCMYNNTLWNLNSNIPYMYMTVKIPLLDPLFEFIYCYEAHKAEGWPLFIYWALWPIHDIYNKVIYVCIHTYVFWKERGRV